MKVPFFFLFQVGLIIGKGGEMIKSMQAKSGARIQVRFFFTFPEIFAHLCMQY